MADNEGSASAPGDEPLTDDDDEASISDAAAGDWDGAMEPLAGPAPRVDQLVALSKCLGASWVVFQQASYRDELAADVPRLLDAARVLRALTIAFRSSDPVAKRLLEDLGKNCGAFLRNRNKDVLVGRPDIAERLLKQFRQRALRLCVVPSSDVDGTAMEHSVYIAPTDLELSHAKLFEAWKLLGFEMRTPKEDELDAFALQRVGSLIHILDQGGFKDIRDELPRDFASNERRTAAVEAFRAKLRDGRLLLDAAPSAYAAALNSLGYPPERSRSLFDGPRKRAAK